MKAQCLTCGNDTPFAKGEVKKGSTVQRCTNCWEVEFRLERYLKDGGEKAEAFIQATIKEVCGY